MRVCVELRVRVENFISNRR